MDATTLAAYRALKVIVLDTEISTFLKANDPNALKQCESALDDLERKYDGIEDY